MLVDLYRFASTSLRRLNKGMDDEVIGIHLGKGGSALLLRDNVLLKTASPASADATDQASATLPVTGLLSVAMPAYNERETLREIITRVRAVPVRKEIIIVDDGSTARKKVLLLHGVDDATVPITGAWRLWNAMETSGNLSLHSFFRTYPGIGHELAPVLMQDCIEWLLALNSDSTPNFETL